MTWKELVYAGRLVLGICALAASIAGCALRTGSGAPGTIPALSNGPARHHSGASVSVQIAFLMTDGSIAVQSHDDPQAWYRYSPDSYGDYSDGTWQRIASLPGHYDPDAFASQVLADGRLLIIGGEYNRQRFALTSLGAIYDPVKNTWTPLAHPNGWQWIGDSPSSMIPDGHFVIGDKLHKWDAALDPKTMKWTELSDAGKADFNAEEGWTLLPGGTILTADVRDASNAEIYNPAAGRWKSTGSTRSNLAAHWPYPLNGCTPYGVHGKKCYYAPGEIGPAMLRPDGTVFATGATTTNGSTPTGTAIYHTKRPLAGTWTRGPNFPTNDSAGDSYAVLEPSGNVLVFGDLGNGYEWNGKTFKKIEGPSTGCPPLLLPTGQIASFCPMSVVIYNPSGSPKRSWAPTIQTYPKRIAAGKTYKITGTQFNGLSQAMAFGDENQNATNYPLVRITNKASGHVFYARTHDHSTMGVATGFKRVWTYFDVPNTIDAGSSSLVVVANGIASQPLTVTVERD